MSESKAIIIGCSGLAFTEEERRFIEVEKPFGLILFARNIGEADQIADLNAEFRELVGNAFAPVLIDQEGGRVQRLRPPLAPNYPHARELGKLYLEDEELGAHATWLMSRLHAFDLLKLGINVNCLPVLDIPIPGAHEVIGKRAYGDEPFIVSKLGQAAADGLKAGGVLPVIKHIPGHGRATVDTHFELPTVDTHFQELNGVDFEPFRALSGELMAMTAHVIFSNIDPHNPATQSKKVIDEIIRENFEFDGLLMSDDVSMEALSGDFGERTRKTFAAGCDVVLHCNGDMGEMREIMDNCPVLLGKPKQRAQAVLNAFVEPDEQVEEQLRQEFEGLTGHLDRSF